MSQIIAVSKAPFLQNSLGTDLPRQFSTEQEFPFSGPPLWGPVRTEVGGTTKQRHGNKPFSSSYLVPSSIFFPRSVAPFGWAEKAGGGDQVSYNIRRLLYFLKQFPFLQNYRICKVLLRSIYVYIPSNSVDPIPLFPATEIGLPL